MADTKISNLPEFTQGQLNSWLPAVDQSGALTTKKISFDNFFRSRGTYFVKQPVTVSSITDARTNSNNIQAAIDAANAAGGGTVHLGAGTYEIADPSSLGYCLEMKSDIRFLGHGDGTILKIYIGDTSNPLSMMENNVAGVSNLEIAHLTLDGTKARLPDTVWGWTENEGIDLNNGDSVWVHHCRIFDFPSDAIDFDNNISSMVTDCFISGNGGPAIHGGLGSLIVNNITSQDNAIYRMQATNDSVRAASACLSWSSLRYGVISNVSSKNDAAGIVLKDATQSVVHGCTVENPGDGVSRPTWPDAYAGNGNSIRLEACKDVVVSACACQSRNTVSTLHTEVYYMVNDDAVITERCTFIGCASNLGREAYKLNQTSYCSVIGCTSNVPAYIHINLLDASPGNSIKNNTVNGGQIGVMLQGASTDNAISDNTVNGTSDAGIRLQGPSTANALYNNKLVNGNRGIRMLTSGGNPDNTQIYNNDVSGNTDPLVTVGTGHKIKNNEAINPVGVSSITVGASPFTYTAGFYPTAVYVQGGTVSDISKGGTTISTTSDTAVLLEPGQSLTVTYSVAPTMVADEL